MKRKWKIALGLLVILAIAGAGFYAYRARTQGVVEVQAGVVSRQDLAAIVTASGEIKPRNYINIGANAQGRITDLFIREGDHVRRNQVVARIENVQASADVRAQEAAVRSSAADSAAAEAGLKVLDDSIKVAEAGLARAQAENRRAQLDWDRAQQLFQAGVIAKQEFDTRKANWEAQQAGVQESEARLQQVRTQRSQALQQIQAAQRRVTQLQANLSRVSDVLARHDAVAPIDGVVTNLPVRVGETVVPGIQNSAASTIMTIADMSVITAEVKVDETDIVNMKLDQRASVTIDAIPGKQFTGKVIEIGNTAILRSSGVAASQSAVSSQEAKDFKVVIALDDPPADIRPGLSCTAKVTTATRSSALTIPIQALTVRTKGDLEPAKEGVQAATQPSPAEEKARREELQGVFVIAGEKAEFRQVKTGITGATDIEVLDGLKEGERIITGSYKAIRTIRNGAKVTLEQKKPGEAQS
ncbi:MAG: efflux RND transporter periplasmic adaptor subunit [Bryobacteraceae bacterium]|nr:efflux RND transporter periplasmic adaptor subunit [Bryobacteraceae bacterium]